MNAEIRKKVSISWQLTPLKIMIVQKQPENFDYFKYVGKVITNKARCTREIKSSIAMAKAAFNETKILFTSKLDLNLTHKLVKC